MLRKKVVQLQEKEVVKSQVKSRKISRQHFEIQINSPLTKVHRQSSEPSHAAILEVIERLGKKQDIFLEKLLEIERSVASNLTLISEIAVS